MTTDSRDSSPRPDAPAIGDSRAVPPGADALAANVPAKLPLSPGPGPPPSGPPAPHRDGFGGGDLATVALLEEDEDLAALLPVAERHRAHARLAVRVYEVSAGPWEPPFGEVGGGWGLLILDGLLARRIVVARALGTELLGPGDLLTPCPPEPVRALSELPRWEALRPTRLAGLDARVTGELATWPQLGLALSARVARRTDRLAQLLAISHLPRLEDRILATLWYLAAICGHVTSRGVAVSIGLTHHAIGELTGAKRPTVTLALRDLRDRGLVIRRDDGGFLLCGEPPPGLELEIQRSASSAQTP